MNFFNKCFSLFFICFVLPASADCLPPNTHIPSEVATSIPHSFYLDLDPDEPKKYIESVVEKLVTNSEDDFQKIRNIHDWIILNIHWEERGDNKQRTLDNLGHVLKYRWGMCSDYALLFQAMCQAAGFDCRFVGGVLLKFFDPFKEDKLFLNAHAWNAVKVQEDWYFVDVGYDDRDDGFIGNKYLFFKMENFLHKRVPIFNKDEYEEDDIPEQALWEPIKLDSFYQQFLEAPFVFPLFIF